MAEEKKEKTEENDDEYDEDVEYEYEYEYEYVTEDEAEEEGEKETYTYRELADGWWKNVDFILPGREIEPTVFEIFHDMMVSNIVGNPKAVEIAGFFVPRVILLEIDHPRRETEYVRIMISPTDIAPGIPDAEPDLIIHFRYYDFIRTILGEIDIMTPLWSGGGWILGNMTAALDLRDIMDAANEREVQKRPKIWPLGSP
ncbi:MAG: hypothetical protein HWN67_03280 [Candidatus Helarchaeota archaeon]|nr:hypothetical protein [Candidatus Helarchaeota archaeon]